MEQIATPAFLDSMSRRGPAPALLSLRDGVLHTLSYEDLARRIRALAAGLEQMGIAAGDPVALIGPNGFDWVTAWFGIVAAGAVAVPLDESAPATDIQTALAGAKARRVICTASLARVLAGLDAGLTLVAFGEDEPPAGARAFGTLLSTKKEISIAPTSPDAPIMFAYTSGTTGAPKAIVLSRSNIAANVDALAAAHLVGTNDRVLLPLPLQHVFPLFVGLLVPLSNGAAVVFPQSATGPHILEAIRLTDVPAIVGVPRLYSAICTGLTARIDTAGAFKCFLFHKLLEASDRLRRSFGLNCGRLLFPAVRARFGRRLRLLVSGGARMEAETFATLSALGFEVRTGYGLAETASMFTGNLPGRERRGSEGKPIAGSMRIAAPDPSGLGEIQLKGPQVFSHYLGNPEATRAAFTEDGWLRTGDVGRIDRDGFLFVSGRVKDTLVLGGGNKADPEELEKAYGASRYIREIAVFVHDGALVALVVPALEATREGGATHIDTAIRVDLASRAQDLPSYQRLAGFAISREPLPRTRLGKFRRFLLPALYERLRSGTVAESSAALTPDDEALLQDQVARQIYEMLLKRSPQKRFGMDASLLLDLGIDSLEWITFSLELEDKLGLRLTEAETADILTVRDLISAGKHATPTTTTLPVPAASRDWIAPTSPALRLLGLILFGINACIMRVLFRLRVSGKEHLPASGSFVVVANHASYLDAPAIAAALGYRVLRRTYWAGDPAILFAKRWQWPFMRAMHCYPMDERAPSRALATSEALLKRGDGIVWFPEGWRSPDGTLQPFLSGIGHLLQRVPVTVVPVHIDGAFHAWPRGRALPALRPIRVQIGKPIPVDAWQAYSSNHKNAPREIADMLARTIEGITPPPWSALK